MPRLETILLATDGSAASEPASEQAIDLAIQMEARLLVVSVLASGRQPSEAAAAHGTPARGTPAPGTAGAEPRDGGPGAGGPGAGGPGAGGAGGPGGPGGPGDSGGTGETGDSRDSVSARTQAIVQRARAAGANATYLVWEGEAGEAIVAAADSEGADLIVVGSHGRSGVSRFLIGSVSDFVVRHAHCPVMVVRGRPEAVRR